MPATVSSTVSLFAGSVPVYETTAGFAFVMPALVLNYFGQGALLLAEPGAIESPFYHLAPDWALVPMVILSTLATVIASQAERQQRQTEQQQQQTEPVGKLYTRDEFRKLLMGKTMDEVLKAIGKPESTSDTPDRNPTWYYKNITHDPLTKETDSTTYVDFRRGRVEDVRF